MSSSDEEDSSYTDTSDDSFVSQLDEETNARVDSNIERSTARFSSLFKSLSCKFLNGLDVSAPDWIPPIQISPGKDLEAFPIENIVYGDDDDDDNAPKEEKNIASLIRPCSVVLTQLVIQEHCGNKADKKADLAESENSNESDAGLGNSLSSSLICQPIEGRTAAEESFGDCASTCAREATNHFDKELESPKIIKIVSKSKPKFLPRRPKKLFDFGDEEEFEDTSPKVKLLNKQHVKIHRTPKLWEIDYVPSKAPIEMDNTATQYHSLSKLQDIQRKELHKKSMKPEEKTTVQQSNVVVKAIEDKKTMKPKEKTTVQQSNVVIKAIEDKRENFVEKDSGFGSSFSSSHCSHSIKGTTTDDSAEFVETENQTSRKQLDETVHCSYLPEFVRKHSEPKNGVDRRDVPCNNKSPTELVLNRPSSKTVHKIDSSGEFSQSFAGRGSFTTGEPEIKSPLSRDNSDRCGESSALSNKSQPAKTSSKLCKVLSLNSFVPRKPRKLVNFEFSDEEEAIETPPKVLRSLNKQQVKKLPQPKLWEIELGPENAPTKMNHSAAFSRTSLSEHKDITKKKKPAKTMKQKKENIIEVDLTKSWNRSSDFTDNATATNSSKRFQDENITVGSNRRNFYGISPSESNKDFSMQIKKKRVLSPSKSKQSTISSFLIRK